tara:strand:- start:13157 stop:14119 length:963 start_codon:yes stop_codon:yes gene_type:complete
MISFIIIGRNEGWKLTKCLQSVFDTISFNNIDKYEVIYVDSKSEDDSIDRVKRFSNVSIISLTGEINAAIARNVGVNHSKGSVLFFIDGDMEIIPGFLSTVYNQNFGLKKDFLSGQFENYYYDQNSKFLKKAEYHSINNSFNTEYTVGGLFLIKRNIWEMIGGMKNYLRRSQDIDLGIRLAGKGYLLHRKKEILAIHHTVSYKNNKRIWVDLFNGNDFYRSLLFRENFFNLYQWKLFLRQNYSLILLFICSLISFYSYNHLYFLPYIFIINLRVLMKKPDNIINYLNLIIYFISRELIFIFSFLFFWPKKNKIFSFSVIT